MIPYGTRVPVAVRQPCELLCTCYFAVLVEPRYFLGRSVFGASPVTSSILIGGKTRACPASGRASRRRVQSCGSLSFSRPSAPVLRFCSWSSGASRPLLGGLWSWSCVCGLSSITVQRGRLSLLMSAFERTFTLK